MSQFKNYRFWIFPKQSRWHVYWFFTWHLLNRIVRQRTFAHVRPVKILIRLCESAVWSESSLGAFSDSQGFKVSSCGQRRLWSDCADVQADLSLRWAHLVFVGTFSDVAAHKLCRIKKKMYVMTWPSEDRSAWAFAQPGQSLPSPPEVSFTRSPLLSNEHPPTILIRYRGCTGWSENSHEINIEISRRGWLVWRRCRVWFVTGASNWYWLTVG